MRRIAIAGFCLLVAAGANAQSIDTRASEGTLQLTRTPFVMCGDRLVMQSATPLAPPFTRMVRCSVANQRVQSVTPSSRRSGTRKVLGAIVGATGGFFAGGYAGAAIEGNRCHCDDPGLKGALIGAPVGAVVGGILGGFYLF